MSDKIIVNVSNRHIHLAQADMEKLFGQGYKLSKMRDLMQPGEHATFETVTIVGPKRQIENVRVLGPLRASTQIEISLTDSILIGVKAPIRVSGDTAGSAPIKVVGPKGTIELKEGCIIAKRHVHMTSKDAERFKAKNGQIVKVKCSGERGLVFDNVVARVSDKMALECHLDTDEANAASVKNSDLVELA